tara:strand:- start:298 stop:537 length:240 start_codon:yes stop_codon:yes gene_type:complete
MLHYSDIYKISNYKIQMDSMSKIRDLKEKITELQNFLEDFINLNQANKKKIANLEGEIRNIKQNMNKYLDELEEIIDQK